MLRDHPLVYLNDMSSLMAPPPPFGEPSANSSLQANPNPNQAKRKRSLPGNPDPEAEVIALSPKSLLATNRFVCEICHKGFQRDQNLQLHRRGHNLPWKLKQRSEKEQRKKVYICPEATCVHHDPSRALGDLTGIKKHFCRKHWEKKWKCERCSKKYAVQSDWKAHIKICGTKEYRCSCGTLFSRRDSFTTHRAFCDALSQENMRSIAVANPLTLHSSLLFSQPQASTSHDPNFAISAAPMQTTFPLPMNTYIFQDQHIKREELHHHHHQQQQQEQEVISPSWLPTQTLTGMELPLSIFSPSPHMSATALLQTAAEMGVTMSSKPTFVHEQPANNGYDVCLDGSIDDAFGGMLGQKRQDDSAARLVRRKEEISDGMTRDFLGLKALYSGDHIIDMAAGLDRSSSAYDQMQQMGGAWHV